MLVAICKAEKNSRQTQAMVNAEKCHQLSRKEIVQRLIGPKSQNWDCHDGLPPFSQRTGEGGVKAEMGEEGVTG